VVRVSALVVPHYAKAGGGRRPVGLGIMLRVYFVQQWFNLSDPGVEEALYESPALRRFVGVDLGVAADAMRRPSVVLGICWRSMHWASRCWRL
jgi:hypothetical protein